MKVFTIYAITSDTLAGIFITSDPTCTAEQAVVRWFSHQFNPLFDLIEYFASEVNEYPELVTEL